MISDSRQLDFNSMIQTSAAGRTRRISCSFGIPEHWTLSDEEMLLKQRGDRPMACPAADDFTTIASEISDRSKLQQFGELLSASTSHHRSNPLQPDMTWDCKRSFNVVRAFHIQNLALLYKYRTFTQQLQQRHAERKITAMPIDPPLDANLQRVFPPVQPVGNCNECVLFHGTKFQTAKEIACEGFDHRVAKESGYYGRGTYFASQACKSAQYSTSDNMSLGCIIIARVVLGHPHYTKKRLRWTRPENKADCVIARPGPIHGHHSGWQTHMEFVSFDNGAAYPEYILLYECGNGW